MRSYFFLEALDSKAFDQLPGCRYISKAGRGQDPELWFDNATMPQDYPAKVALLWRLPGTEIWQAMTLIDDGGALLKICQGGAAKAGVVVHADAKALALARPAIADAHLYPRRPVFDGDGQVIGDEKVPGSALRVAVCLAGDSPTDCADPVAASAAGGKGGPP